MQNAWCQTEKSLSTLTLPNLISLDFSLYVNFLLPSNLNSHTTISPWQSHLCVVPCLKSFLPLAIPETKKTTAPENIKSNFFHAQKETREERGQKMVRKYHRDGVRERVQWAGLLFCTQTTQVQSLMTNMVPQAHQE